VRRQGIEITPVRLLKRIYDNSRPMNNALLYSHHISGRRLAMYFVLWVSLAMMVFATRYSAAWYFLVPVGLSAAMALWAIIANPQTGSTLTAQTLHFFNRGTKETVQIKDVISMKVTNWTDGPDTVALTLKSGNVIHVPSMCADSKLAVALRELGVPER
jgi:uncharacterized membrane protein